jgi:hypothetical protein
VWCFIDESWNESGGRDNVGVLFAVTLPYDAISKVGEKLFAVRAQYYGRDHAKNLFSELKGTSLLSRSTFKLAAMRTGPMPKNLCIVREVLTWLERNRESLKLDAFASIIYGVNPTLECLNPRNLEIPFRELLRNISACCAARMPGDRVTLVFDQRTGAQKGNAIAVSNFIAGTNLPNVCPYPYFAVSNIAPVAQVADIAAYITAKRAVGDRRFVTPWFASLMKLQWKGEVQGQRRYGFRRYDQYGECGFRSRATW